MLAFTLATFVLALVGAFWLSYNPDRNFWRKHCRTWSLWHTGTHTEYCGPGRVWFVSFFRGAGYVVRIRSGRGWDGKPLDAPGWRPNVYIPGFTLYVRTHASRIPTRYGTGTPVRHVRLTRNANRPVI